MATPVFASYKLYVDWANDGSFASSGDDITNDVRWSPAVTIQRGRDQMREMSPPMVGAAARRVENRTGTYSSQNTGSAIYPNVLPGRPTAIDAVYGGTTYQIERGFLDVPKEAPGPTTLAVDLPSLDGLAKLKAARVSTAMLTNVTTDVAIAAVLDAAGWTAARSLDTGATTLARWWVDDIDAFTAIRDLVYSEGPPAIFYVDGSGTLVFESRHYRFLTGRCTSSQVTLRSNGSEPLFTDFTYDPGVKSVVNSASVPVRSYAVAALAVIWTGPASVTLGAGETRTYTVSTTADGFTGALAPVAATDYALTSGTLTSATLNRTSGSTAKLTLVDGGTGCTLTGLQVRAQPVTTSEQTVSSTLDTSASQTAYGLRTLPTDFTPAWLPDVDTATDYSNYVVGRYQAPVPQIAVTMNNGDATRLVQALSRKISDRITAIENLRAYVNADVFIEGVEHTLLPGANHQTTFRTEQAGSQVFWILGQAGYSELGATTKLGF